VKHARRISLLVTAAGLAACGGDLTAVKGKVVDPAPEGSAFRSTFGDDALYYVVDLEGVTTTSSGHFTQNDPPGWPSGTYRTGTLDRATGAFDVVLTLPDGYFYTQVRDAGTLGFTGPAIVSASYEEDRHDVTGHVSRYDAGFEISGVTLTLHAKNLDDGVLIDSSVGTFPDRLAVIEQHRLENVYREDIASTYWNAAGMPYLQQQWSRDELATAVSPDSTGDFTINTDGSGSGSLRYNFDHDIYQVYTVDQAADGSYTSTVLYEDPGTPISPDGSGVFHIAADFSGNGTYTESYVDGAGAVSGVRQEDYVYVRDGSTLESFRFDDVATAYDPDTDGDTTYEYDGSGTGEWRRHDATGVIQTCQYSFDSAGSILELSCN
jgi:hypothetical protein